MASVETELRLGLPGGELEILKGSGKRVFSEIVDLKLKFPAAEEGGGAAVTAGENLKSSAAAEAEKPPAPKAQVVGWPPVRSFRRNVLSAQQEKDGAAKEDKSKSGGKALPSMAAAPAFVKVSMDGAPYLRKVDLRNFQTYQDLSMALEEMFGSFSCADNGRREGDSLQARDFMREKRSMDLLQGSDYVPTYEDKDGDWMLVGDVPWEMFVNSCKRLRIMRGSDAMGLVPGCKNKE